MEPSKYQLHTERLGLRHYLHSDLDDLGEVFSDPYAARFYPTMQEATALHAWINWNISNYQQHGFGLWAVELLETGRYIGDAGLTYQSVGDQKELEVGYHIHPKQRGFGYASEAASACLEYAFVRLKTGFVCSIVDPENIASQKVASRIHSAQRMFQGKQGPMLLFSTNTEQFTERSDRTMKSIA